MEKPVRIYTRKGDKGKTRLASGRIVFKHHTRIEAYGSVHETNAAIGFARASIQESLLINQITTIQEDLFCIGAILALPEEDLKKTVSSNQIKPKRSITLNSHHITALEKAIDLLNKELPLLDSFILPGGTETAARFHMASTICRRTERCLIRLSQEGDYLHPDLFSYINRLSDYLFIAARYTNHKGEDDLKWSP